MANPDPQADGVRIYRRLLGYVFPHWRAFLVASIGLAIVGATETAFAALMKPLLDGSFINRDPEVIRLTPIALIGLFLVRGTASYLATYWMSWIARRVIKELRGQMFEHLLRLPVSFFDNTPSGTLLAKLTYNVDQVAQSTTGVITIFIRDSLTSLGLLGWMFYIDWQLAVLLLVGTPLIAWLIGYINRRFRRFSTRIQDSVGDLTSIAEEAIEGQRVVKTFGGQSYEGERFAQANEQNRSLNMKLESTSAAAVPVVQFIAAIASAGVIYFAVSERTLSVGSFMSFITAMMMLLAPIKRLTQINATIQRGIAAAQSIFDFIDTPTERDRGQGAVQRAKGEVCYRDVSFAYAADGADVLDRIGFDARAGQTIAFVGRSGSGKSTLVSLLPRFYEIDRGQILLDGRDIRDLGLESLRAQMALVTQHITLFNDTIANNIAYGSLRHASREAIVEAARAAHAMEFIEQLPQGLDTVVGENGVLLSGGQRQRLAIARALLKDAPILILDEATSALDTESERYIQAALEQLMRTRTTLVIAHRLSTIEKADRILVMEQGRVVESGRHDELLARNGHYAALYRMQFSDAGAED